MFVVVPRSDRLRSAVEDTIRHRYWKRYEAFLCSFAKTIVAELSQTGNIECAAGIRFGNEPFFSECYFDLPIERVLEDRLAGTINRGRIVEVSHLAGIKSGRSLPFVQNLIELLRAMESEWAIFTATKALRHLLQRNGLAMVELGRAERSRVSNPDSWGHYFSHDPRIMAVGHRTGIGSKRFRPALTATEITADARIF